ncbi:MAG TPA: hypothetical protein VLL54_20490 [Pyrinomonadaceae bacterium]|nr:hypothetical protein [Pyrinomonadaceae bacterium]
MKTWKTGDGKITEKVLNVSLRTEPQYKFVLDDPTDPEKHYELRFIARSEHTLRTRSLPCWSADFRELTKDKASGGNFVGFHLLSTEGPGVGDYFSRKEWAAHFCPIEEPNEVLDGHFYPIRTERRFLIEGFLVAFKVVDYRYDETKARLKNLDLVIEFRNSPQDELLSRRKSAHAKSKNHLLTKN